MYIGICIFIWWVLLFSFIKNTWYHMHVLWNLQTCFSSYYLRNYQIIICLRFCIQEKIINKELNNLFSLLWYCGVNSRVISAQTNVSSRWNYMFTCLVVTTLFQLWSIELVIKLKNDEVFQNVTYNSWNSHILFCCSN